MKRDALLVLVALGLAVGVVGRAHAVCRVVQPAEESGEKPVAFDPTTSSLFVVAPNQIVDYRCPPITAHTNPAATIEGSPLPDEAPDAPVPDGASEGEDGGDGLRASPTLVDRGAAGPGAAATRSPLATGGYERLVDAGVITAEEPEREPCWDGSMPEPVRDTVVHVVVQPKMYANGGQAGLVMPLPRRADVHAGPPELFSLLQRHNRARVTETVHFEENPELGAQCSDPHYSDARLHQGEPKDGALEGILSAPLAMYGCAGGDAGGYYRPGTEHRDADITHYDGGTVTSESIETTELYEVTVLNASTMEALQAWLDENGFAHDATDDQAFGHYVHEGAWFMAVKVMPDDRGGEQIALPPLVASWRGEEVPIMNRLQHDPAGGRVITDAWVIAPTRMQLESGAGDVQLALEASLDEPSLGGFGVEEGWITRIQLMRRVAEELPDSRLVPAPSEEELRPHIERERTVGIAAACCPDNGVPAEGRTFTETFEYMEGDPPSQDEYFYTSPEPTKEMCENRYSPYGDSDYYYCAASKPKSPRLTAALASWLPIVLMGAILVWRRRR